MHEEVVARDIIGMRLRGERQLRIHIVRGQPRLRTIGIDRVDHLGHLCRVEVYAQLTVAKPFPLAPLTVTGTLVAPDTTVAVAEAILLTSMTIHKRESELIFMIKPAGFLITK